MLLKEVRDYNDIIGNASKAWHKKYTSLLEKAMAYHLHSHVLKKADNLGISYEDAHRLTWLDQWAAEGEMYVRAFVEILRLDNDMLETLLTGTFIISEERWDSIPGYTCPNLFLVGLGALDPGVFQIMKNTVECFGGRSQTAGKSLSEEAVKQSA